MRKIVLCLCLLSSIFLVACDQPTPYSEPQAPIIMPDNEKEEPLYDDGTAPPQAPLPDWGFDGNT